MRLVRVVGSSIVMSLALASCATAPSVRTIGGAPGYSIRYLEATPKPGTALSEGKSVTIEVTVAYTLEVAARGRVVLVLQKEDDSPLLPGREQVEAEVSQGSGKVTVKDTFEVPRGARTVRLYVPLVPEGIARTSGELLIEYPVR